MSVSARAQHVQCVMNAERRDAWNALSQELQGCARSGFNDQRQHTINGHKQAASLSILAPEKRAVRLDHRRYS